MGRLEIAVTHSKQSRGTNPNRPKFGACPPQRRACPPQRRACPPPARRRREALRVCAGGPARRQPAEGGKHSGFAQEGLPAAKEGLPAEGGKHSGFAQAGSVNSVERILSANRSRITIHDSRITDFLIATHANSEIAVTHSQQRTSHVLIATQNVFPQITFAAHSLPPALIVPDGILLFWAARPLPSDLRFEETADQRIHQRGFFVDHPVRPVRHA